MKSVFDSVVFVVSVNNNLFLEKTAPICVVFMPQAYKTFEAERSHN